MILWRWNQKPSEEGGMKEKCSREFSWQRVLMARYFPEKSSIVLTHWDASRASAEWASCTGNVLPWGGGVGRGKEKTNGSFFSSPSSLCCTLYTDEGLFPPLRCSLWSVTWRALYTMDIFPINKHTASTCRWGRCDINICDRDLTGRAVFTAEGMHCTARNSTNK